MVLTNNKNIADLCRSMVNQGRKVDGNKWLEHVRLGYNYRLNEMSAVLGLSQLKRTKEVIRKREKIVKLYNQKLKNITEVEAPSPAKSISWFVYVIKLKGKACKKRDEIVSRMAERGIQCGSYFYPIHLQPFLKKEFKKSKLPITEDVGKRTLALPFYNQITKKEIEFVVDSLKKILND